MLVHFIFYLADGLDLPCCCWCVINCASVCILTNNPLIGLDGLPPVTTAESLTKPILVIVRDNFISSDWKSILFSLSLQAWNSLLLLNVKIWGCRHFLDHSRVQAYFHSVCIPILQLYSMIAACRLLLIVCLHELALHYDKFHI